MALRRVKAIVEYDGTRYLGFQAQTRGDTIQGELERALAQITGERVPIVGAGRTDAGVHATGQVISFATGWARSLVELGRALNARLPGDIAVREVSEVPWAFHARKSALRREYRYTILNRALRSPKHRLYAHHWSGPLDPLAMQAACQRIEGMHDFSGFGQAPAGENTARQIYRADCQRQGEFIYIEVEANAFLRRMMRRLVAGLLQVGSGKMSPDEFGEILEAPDRRRIKGLAPSQGLCLTRVDYAESWVGVDISSW
ncbi:MAG: tRNA pseudouridine(38-40) synthase TruA [Chloroflexi bacterium]|nr:tRNA pseudouridine(38-40) synthase TruA [Chloroflexota bacterium]